MSSLTPVAITTARARYSVLVKPGPFVAMRNPWSVCVTDTTIVWWCS